MKYIFFFCNDYEKLQFLDSDTFSIKREQRISRGNSI